jgi:hypothetical protein
MRRVLTKLPIGLGGWQLSALSKKTDKGAEKSDQKSKIIMILHILD